MLNSQAATGSVRDVLKETVETQFESVTGYEGAVHHRVATRCVAVCRLHD